MGSSMEDWIVVLLIISTVLACWGFSLLLRLLSEFIARKRKRLRAEHQRRGVVFALIAMALSWCGALLSGWVAVDLTRTMSEDDLGKGSLVVAVSFGLVLFSLMLLIWAVIGDRSRGRLRCPRCWYDMEGIDTPQCPECGRAINSPRQLRRARRAKWPFGLVVFFLGIAVYGFTRADLVEDTDELALIPTWFLMLGWERLPENWILYENSPYYATLDARLGESWRVEDHDWMSDRRKRRFGLRLCKGLLGTPQQRWDPRRMALISELSDQLLYREDMNNPEADATWLGSPVDSDALLRLCAEEIMHAITEIPMSEESAMIIERASFATSYSYDSNPYLYASTLNWFEIREQLPLDEVREQFVSENAALNDDEIQSLYYNELRLRSLKHTREVLSEVRQRLESPEIASLMISDHETHQQLIYVLSIESGAIQTTYPVLMQPTQSEVEITLADRASMLGWVMPLLDEATQEDVYARLLNMLRSEDGQEADYAANMLMGVVDSLEITDRSEISLYDACVQAAAAHLLNDFSAWPDEQYESRHELGMELMLSYDTSGRIAYPLVLRELIDDPRNAPELPYSTDAFGPTDHIKAWVENFAQLVGHDDPDVHEWIINNLPVELGTPYDEQLDQIAVRYLNDPKEYLADTAEEKLFYRKAENLIAPSYEHESYWDF